MSSSLADLGIRFNPPPRTRERVPSYRDTLTQEQRAAADLAALSDARSALERFRLTNDRSGSFVDACIAVLRDRYGVDGLVLAGLRQVEDDLGRVARALELRRAAARPSRDTFDQLMDEEYGLFAFAPEHYSAPRLYRFKSATFPTRYKLLKSVVIFGTV